METNDFMDIPDRIRYLREDILKIKQSEMSLRLGLKQGSLSDIERKKTKNVTDRVITDICREFSVNEHWLRTGKGEMFVKTDDAIITQLSNQYKLSEVEHKLLQAYLRLNETSRSKLVEFVIEFNKSLAENSPPELAATLPARPAASDEQLSREEAHRMLDQQWDAAEKGQTLSASTITSGLGKQA